MEQSSLLKESLPMIIPPLLRMINEYLEEPYSHIKEFLKINIGRPETIDHDSHFVYTRLLPRQKYFKDEEFFVGEETIDDVEHDNYIVLTETLSELSKLPPWAEQYVGENCDIREDLKNAFLQDYELLEKRGNIEI